MALRTREGQDRLAPTVIAIAYRRSAVMPQLADAGAAPALAVFPKGEYEAAGRVKWPGSDPVPGRWSGRLRLVGGAER